jgi:tRNA A37 methylthiotransferase MiaB
LVKWLRPNVLNISKFWPRPGTYAARLQELDGNIVKLRSGEITELFEKLARGQNKAWVGRECEVLINEEGKNGTMMGRNFAYRPIVIKTFDLGIVGNKVKVEIVSAEITHLVGIIKK